MPCEAKILKASVSPVGVPLYTFEVKFPRIVLAEFNTHRVFSRNSASSRAIPVEKMIQLVLEDPYVPTHWGKNQKGMQAEVDVSLLEKIEACNVWLRARDLAVEQTRRLLKVGIHKQITNRLLEPFMWHTVIVTATEWDNFFHLRNNKDAHPDIRDVAALMQELYEKTEPEALDYGRWHLPLVHEEDYEAFCDSDPAALPTRDLVKVSVGRCARVSYLTHDGKRDIQADVKLHDRLLESGHLSPFEHVARPMTEKDTHQGGNFRGWVQYRKTIPNESDILGSKHE